MKITITDKIDPRHHPEIRRLITLGFLGVNKDGVVVEVRPRSADVFSGSCWCSRRSVLLRLPYDIEGPEGRYPMTLSDHRLKDGPVCTFADWRERLLHLAAHEASHVRQYDRPKPGKVGNRQPRQSEREAERWAKVVLDKQRGKINSPSGKLVLVPDEEDEMAATGPDLIDYFNEKQTLMQYNDTRFAQFLGINDLSTWLRYKRRQRPPPLRLMQLAVRRWPKERASIFEAAVNSNVRGQMPEPVSA